MYNKELNILGYIVGAVGIGYAVYTSHKMNRICEKIGSSLENMTDSIDIDIPTTMIDKAIDMTIDREVSRAVSNASDKAVREIKMDIHGQIKQEVDAVYTDIRKQVSDKVSAEVARIDMKKLSKDITEKAEDKIIEKFDGNLDEITAKYNRELNTISSIYSSIANSMAPNTSKEAVLRIV